MADKSPPETKPEKKGPIGKLKDALIPDQEESAAIISTFVRITVLAWSGAILTLNYVSIPGIPQQKIDPTFIASVFTGVLSSLGIQTASKKGDGTYKADEERKKAEAANGSVTTVRFETGVKIIPVQPRIDPISGKEIDPQTGRLT